MPRTLRQRARDAIAPTPEAEPTVAAEPPQTAPVIVRRPFFWGGRLQPKGTALDVPMSVSDVLRLKGLVDG